MSAIEVFGGNIIPFPVRGNIRPITKNMADRAPHDQPGWFDLSEEKRDHLVDSGKVVPLKAPETFLVDLLRSLEGWQINTVNPFLDGRVNSIEQCVRLVAYLVTNDAWPHRKKRVQKMREITQRLEFAPPIEQWFALDTVQQDLIYPLFRKNQPHEVNSLVLHLNKHGWPSGKNKIASLNGMALRIGLMI